LTGWKAFAPHTAALHTRAVHSQETATWHRTLHISSGCGRKIDVERTALNTLAALFDALSIRWVLIGALAANRYRSTPRLTMDVDVLLADTGPGLTELERKLRDDGWTVRRADAAGELLRLTHPQLGIADILIAGTDYQQQAIGRARREPIDASRAVPVLTVEDVVVHKLIAGRLQDLADVEAILIANAPMDREYVEHWASFWDVADAWHALQEQASKPGSSS
jgi:hypothetical protein